MLAKAAVRSRQDVSKLAVVIEKIKMAYLRAMVVSRASQGAQDTPCAAIGSGGSSPSSRLLASAQVVQTARSAAVAQDSWVGL